MLWPQQGFCSPALPVALPPGMAQGEHLELGWSPGAWSSGGEPRQPCPTPDKIDVFRVPPLTWCLLQVIAAFIRPRSSPLGIVCHWFPYCPNLNACGTWSKATLLLFSPLAMIFKLMCSCGKRWWLILNAKLTLHFGQEIQRGYSWFILVAFHLGIFLFLVMRKACTFTSSFFPGLVSSWRLYCPIKWICECSLFVPFSGRIVEGWKKLVFDSFVGVAFLCDPKRFFTSFFC